MMDAKIFPYLESMLDLTARRQQTLSSNIANMDTPGYKSMDVTFDQQLLESMDSNNGQKPALQMVEGRGKMKSNGNNVDLEGQMTEITKNGLQYVTLVQYLNHKLRTLKMSINEGGRG